AESAMCSATTNAEPAPRCTAACWVGLPESIVTLTPLLAMSSSSDAHKLASVDLHRSFLDIALEAMSEPRDVGAAQAASFLYCAPEDEPNACDRSMTARVDPEDPGPRAL